MTDLSLTMYVRKKKYPSGNIGVIVVEKIAWHDDEVRSVGVNRIETELWLSLRW